MLLCYEKIAFRSYYYNPKYTEYQHMLLLLRNLYLCDGPWNQKYALCVCVFVRWNTSGQILLISWQLLNEAKNYCRPVSKSLHRLFNFLFLYHLWVIVCPLCFQSKSGAVIVEILSFINFFDLNLMIRGPIRVACVFGIGCICYCWMWRQTSDSCNRSEWMNEWMIISVLLPV